MRRVIPAPPFDKKTEFPDFSCKVTYAHGWTWHFMKFWASRKSKNMQNLTFCHFFELQKSVLGELRFDRANEFQIQKFQLGWKLDSQTFPTSLLLPNLATYKCPKYGSKGALHVRQGGATCWAVFTGNSSTAQEFAQLWPVLTWDGIFHPLWCN